MDKRPMLATPSTGASNRAPIDIHTLAGTHYFDLKMDGIRAFAFWDGAKLTLINRNGVDITARFPELVEAAPGLGSLPVWLDGEIVADDGRFETTATRDKQTNQTVIARMIAGGMRVSFYAFDMPLYADNSNAVRRQLLTGTAGEWNTTRLRAGHPSERFLVTPMGDDPSFLDQTRALGLEGVIAKRCAGLYRFGARSRDWIKFKNLHRVTCLVTGYEPGTGARAHFGKMNLAVYDDAGQLVPCGNVGTGFTGSEITSLKELLDKGETLVVEIECLNLTSGGTLRFPVYKGTRTDVPESDCTITQLSTLPRC